VPDIIAQRVSAPSALYAFVIAALVVGLVGTPLAIRLARRLKVVDRPGGRRIHDQPVPLLGGLGIMLGIVVAVALNLPFTHDDYAAILVGAVLISLLGAIDDGLGAVNPDGAGISPPLKFLGQAACAVIPVSQGVTIDHFTLPFIDPVSLGAIQYPITVVFIVAVANIVNFADGMDGLAAGLCLISAGTFCVLALSLDRFAAATLAAAVCGACLGFLPWNFHPAKVFMGDAGSLPLGFLLASMSITGVMKTAAALALVFPLIVLLVPILDTSFVILKRLKYKQSVTAADRNHLHHRMLRVGYSQRQAALFLYGWCLVLAAFALAVRFLHYKHRDGSIDVSGTLALSAFALVALSASVFVVYELEIIKYRHLRMLGIARNADPEDDVPLVTERRRRREGVIG
jgi:UDP-GlcNAc:undecaprenyl-phosphate/decaprenyl-phosphate GlcNAc-1-phosphate transferase